MKKRLNIPAQCRYKDLYFISDKAKKELGYSPVVSLDEGIIKTVEWFKNTKEKLIK